MYDVGQIASYSCGDGVDKGESLAVFHVQIAHGGELLCACRVEDLQHALSAVNLNLSTKMSNFISCA